MEIKKFSYRKTNYFLISGNDNYILFDAGWPCTYLEYAKALKEQTNVPIQQIKWVIVSHFHLDHAGLVGEMIKKGITCVVFEPQLDKIDEMEQIIKKKQKDYVLIDKKKLFVMKSANSREWLIKLGIDGEIIETSEHSEDSISFVANDGTALIGDLYPEGTFVENDKNTETSWQKLKKAHANFIYPAHGNEYVL